MLWPIAVILTACVALPQSINTRLATNQIVSLVAGLALALVVAAVCRSIADVRWAVHVLLAVGSAVCLLSLRGAGSLEAARGARRVDNRLRGTFTEPNQFGCFSAIVLVLAVSVFVAARTRVERAGALVAVVAALSALTLSLSRGAWIGAAVGVVVVVARRPQIWRTVALAAAPIALVLVGVASLGSLPEEFDVVRARISTLASPTDNPYDTRPAIWREARREIAEKPLTGHGPGQFEVVSKRTAGEGASASAYHAHNVLLTVGAEIGLLAVAFVVAFTLGLLRLVRSTLHRIPDDRDGALVAGLGGALAVIVGQGFVDFTLRNAVIFALLATLVGLLLAAAVAAASASARPDRRA
jgi:O-antigen ligase